MSTITTVQIGQHYNRSLVDSAVVQYNTEKQLIEILNKPVPQEHIPVIRQRAKNSGTGPNIAVESMIVHKTGTDSTAAYRISSNRYGLTVVPWSLVNPEEIRKDATIIAFQTEHEDRILTISKDKNIISASFQYADEGSLIFDSMIKRVPGDPVNYAIIEDVLYVFCSEKDYDLILMFSDYGDKDPAEIVQEFRETRAFLL